MIWHQSMHLNKRVQKFLKVRKSENRPKSYILGRIFQNRPPVTFCWRSFDTQLLSLQGSSHLPCCVMGGLHSQSSTHYHFVTMLPSKQFVIHYHHYFCCCCCHHSCLSLFSLLTSWYYSFPNPLFFTHLEWISFS